MRSVGNFINRCHVSNSPIIGNLPVANDFLNINFKISTVTFAVSLNSLVLIVSGPDALCIFRFWSKVSIPGVVMVISSMSGCGLGPLSGKTSSGSLV